jgi:rod shape-determining protein MreD
MNRNLGRKIVYGIIIFIIASLQSSNVLAIVDINPDLLLIVAILHSLKYGEYSGVIFGFFTGLLEDTLSGTLFGMNAFILTLVSWLTSIYKKYIFVSDVVAFLIYVVIATIIKYIFFVLLTWIFKRGDLPGWIILLKMAGEIAYNCLIGLILFYLAPLMYKKEESPF